MGLVRRQAAGDTQQVDPGTLQDRLADPDAEQRRRAALDLDGHAEAVPALLARVPAETDLAVRDAVLTTLAAIDALLPMAGPQHAAVLQAARDRFLKDPVLHFTIDTALPALAEVET